MRRSIKALTGLSGSALATLTCSAVLFGAHASDAHAYEHVIYVNSVTDRCLAALGNSVVVTPVGCSGYPAATDWTQSGMGNGGVRLQNRATGTCVDMSSLGLRMFGCQRAFGPYAVYQSWRVHQDQPGITRLQAFWGGGCLANYDTSLRLAGCTTPGHAGYKNQTWLKYRW
jgi:hypothetical protein